MAGNSDVIEYRELDAEELKDSAEIYSSFQGDSVRVGPKGYYLLGGYKKCASDIYNMPLRPSDIFVASYQRSGTTWTQELVWLLANDLNYEKAAAVPIVHRFPFLELSIFFDDASIESVLKRTPDSEQLRKFMETMSTPATKILAEMPSPRFVKTHMPMSLLPPKLLDTCKVVYVARDPRDVIVSSFHHGLLFKLVNGPKDFKLIWKAFKKNLFNQTPYFEHVKEAWAQRNHPNMLFLFYEDLLEDLQSSIRRVAKFLNKELTQEQVERLCDHLSIENFKKNKSVNYEEMRDVGVLADNETFIRKGKSGGWRDYFDEDMTKELDCWIAQNLRDSDLRFPSIKML